MIYCNGARTVCYTTGAVRLVEEHFLTSLAILHAIFLEKLDMSHLS